MKKKRTKRDLYTTWKYLSSIPGWLRLLWVTKEYSEEELTELELIDDEFLRVASEEKKKWLAWKRENLPRTAHDWLEVFPEAEHLVPKVKKSERNFQKQKEIARNVDLVDVAEEYTTLQRSGMYSMVGLCPLPSHNEKTPSFNIYTDSNHYYCYGCHEHGDAIKFIREVEKLTFKQAVRTLYRYSQQI